MFNDPIAAKKFSGLVREHGFITAIETGTHQGFGAINLSAHIPVVHTIEIDPEHRETSVKTFFTAGFNETDVEDFSFNRRKFVKGNQTLYSYLGNSPEVMEYLLSHRPLVQPAVFYLDAHWKAYWPLLDELKVIAKHGLSEAFIIIHDFKNPNHPDFAFDNHGGKDLDIDYVKADLAAINPKFRLFYNEQAEGNKRGILYCSPK